MGVRMHINVCVCFCVRFTHVTCLLTFQMDPLSLRDAPKPRRKPPPRQKEKEPGIKIEGTDVKLENEFGEGDVPRK